MDNGPDQVGEQSPRRPRSVPHSARADIGAGRRGLRNTLANTPTSSPEYSYSGTFDGKDYPDPRTPGRDQTLAHWHLAPDVIVRQQKTDGQTSEWVIYTVSFDGKVFTSISWAPSNPELQDVQVFTRGN